MIDNLRKKYADVFLKPYLIWYLKKERTTTVGGFRLLVKPTVFHPDYFFSSRFLFDFISTLELKDKQFLEIGCGSGFVSLKAYQKQAVVTVLDINDKAIECTLHNFKENFGVTLPNLRVFQSDILDALPSGKFDIIVINPPYFFDEILTNDQLAWNCGKNGEFFIKLFSSLHRVIHANTLLYMVLADNCEIERIKKIAETYRFSMELTVQKKIKWETNFIFKITTISLS
ncbi:MAG: methyltransferase [Bacteroidetes bacterium]|nr:methyltransferase [Bacteroidota bacterium]